MNKKYLLVCECLTLLEVFFNNPKILAHANEIGQRFLKNAQLSRNPEAIKAASNALIPGTPGHSTLLQHAIRSLNKGVVHKIAI